MSSIMDNMWDEIKERVSVEISSVSFEAWFSKVKPYCITEGTLVLLCKNTSVKKLMNTEYYTKIKHAAESARLTISNFKFIIENEKNNYTVEDSEEKIDSINITYENNFNTAYTFEELVVGDSNNFVAAAAKAVAESPGNTYNPLFIYGGVGLGKTHILQAIGQEILNRKPKKKVIYVTTESFTNELINSIRHSNIKQAAQFRNKYRSCDVLLIDDVQFLVGKNSTQDALFNIFNDLYNNKKQIVFTCDRNISEMSGIEERLVSRFSWGLIADIQIPSFETRLAILQKKIFKYHYNIENEVLEYISKKHINSIRILEGMLNTVVFYIQLNSDKLKHTTQLQLAREALKDYETEKAESISIETILDNVCNYYNISVIQIKSPKRNKELAEARQIAMYLITELLPQIPLATIGNHLSRDHTTVMHARDKITELFKIDARIKQIILDLLASFSKK